MGLCPGMKRVSLKEQVPPDTLRIQPRRLLGLVSREKVIHRRKQS
jgi:hypothetical protein